MGARGRGRARDRQDGALERGAGGGPPPRARTTTTRPSEAEAALPFAALIDLLSDLADEALPALSAPQARALESVLLRAEPDRSAAMHLLVSVAVLRTLEETARQAAADHIVGLVLLIEVARRPP